MFRMKSAIFLCFTLVIGSVFPLDALAFSVEKLPVKQSSQLWTVELGAGSAQYSNRQKPKGTDFNVYSLDIRSKSDAAIEMQNVQIEAFRNQPNTHIQYELFTKNAHKDVRNHGSIIHHHIFPVSANSNEIEVTITWSKHGEHKKYKETFIFTQRK